MAIKLQLITELAESTAHRIAKNPANWTSFLKTAAWNYKYPFQDQVLIYAQRLDATACAPIEVWNEKLGRWVNKGAKGIALIDDSGGRLSLRHVFDVSDTNSRYNHPVVLWEMKDGYAGAVTERLENTFGGLEEKLELAAALISAARNAVEDNFPDYLSELVECRENSFLEELDGQNVEVIFKEVLISSVAYMLLIRCGCDAGKYWSFEDVQSVSNFNTLDTVSCLGAATSDISEMILREIGATVRELQKAEENPNRTFAKNQEAGHNESEKQNISFERGGEDGTDLHAAGRLPDSRPDAAGESGAHRQVWDVAQDISEKPQERNIRELDAGGQTERPPGGDRPDGEGEDRTDHGKDADRESSVGQSSKPAELDGAPEQPAAFGGGNSTGGDRLQLSIFPTVEQQIETIEQAEDEKSFAFSISQEEIDHALCRGTGFQNGKYRVYLHYREQHTAKETIGFLKREYGIGGGTHIFTDGTCGNHWHDGKGISLSKSGSLITNPELRLSWNQVAKRLGELIAAGRYLNGKEREYLEIEYLPIYEQQVEERRRQLAEQAYAREILNREPAPLQEEKLLLSENTRYAFSPGDTVYLGADEYEIFSLEGGKVMLRDTSFPLFSRELARDDLENMLRENPLNDHLLVIGEEPVQIIEEQSGQKNTEEMFPRDLYQAYLPGIVNRIRTGESYPYLRDRDIDPESAEQELKEAINRIVLSMRGEHPAFFEAYATLPRFKEWLDEDVFQRTYEDFLTEERDSVTLHADDPDAPAWVRATGDITITREGGTVTIDSGGDGDRNYVEFDLELPGEQEEKPAEKEMAIGMKLVIEDRRFEIEAINQEAETVSLRDITFQQSTDFPIFRRESITFVRGILAQVKEPVQQQTQHGKISKVSNNIQPETSKQPRVNFRITSDNLGVGGQKTKYGWNFAAIRLLNQLEEQSRLATPEEKETLSKYVGWGSLPQVFDGQNSQWAKEYAELKELLTEDEYTSARASTLNAHYTSPIVIKAIYDCLANMGFKTGNILEPACGIGNFFGLVPESMKNSKLYGVELDSITGRVAKQLYQNASIAVQGYEETSLPDSFFDVAVGNVPFGSYGVADKKYDKHKFYIHDYFFAKTLDKVRPGGIIAFITSKGTMDKQNPEVRKYIAQRAELLGAVRLPNNAFLANAGTEVTADILFLQKRDRVIDIEPDWVHLSTTEGGIPVNRYFADNPDMVLGTMDYDERMYGNKSETTCIPYEDADVGELLREALENIHAEITEYELDELADDADASIPADPNVRNFSYCLVGGAIYYRENSRMNRVETSVTAEGRIKGMIAIRDCVRDLIEYQTEDYGDETIQEQQRKLNNLYDAFVAKYGLLNSRGNSMAFSDDSSYCLLCSLEILDENGELERKADMFTKRTIRQRTNVAHVDTAAEALAISIAEKARVDLELMQSLTGLSEERLADDLQGVIFRDFGKVVPENVPSAFFQVDSFPYVTADEYLSGNVREKLKQVRELATILSPEQGEKLASNIKALEAVQPKDLSASEIDVRLGATWLPPEVVKDFIFELLETPYMYRRYIDVFYSSYTANWNVKGKNDDRSDNIKANVTYGTKRINAYKIVEETLNLRDVRIFDTVCEDGVERRVLNKKETAIAQQKQEAIKEAFQNWIWKDPERREVLTRIYNDRFNSIRPREYDGSHIRFTGMNPEISLRKHQVDAVAHILYGGNTLLAHCVGAGKTYEMTAAAMESKHLGLCNKSLFVVPNHLTEQWAGEFLQLYPSANILVATKKDFETQTRKKFCARIATGDYDAVIIGHSQFEKIPISQERQKRQLEEQMMEITSGIQELKEERGERYAIKQLEKTRKTLKLKLDKLNDTSRKDDVVTFEELGVDRLFVDEADFYKNLFLYTKMRNVAGLSQTEAQKSSDLFAKCRYLDELTEGRGVIFATGTPISNSITEMYTMQRYLQYEVLRQNGLQHFDCWASTFGETVTAIELAPEGTGYRAKTRFARFYNLPELMNMFKEVADIKTADMLNLPVPKANYRNVAVKPSEFQQDMVAELAERAERVRNRMVEPNEDNMLKITNDGRKLALDQRLANPMLPDYEDSKVNACVENIFRFWQENRDKKLTQLVFCDLSTPKGDGNFNVYEDVRQKLTARGVTAEEVAFIHDANTETKKKELFVKVRKGQVRILLGSTFKMGAGTNVQDKLIALHDLDCPWRPRDLEQRSGRIVRQGNKNGEVHIFRYVTENTFDAYLYQILENKQRFISQIMTSKSPVRSAEDIDETALSYAEVKALATGNPYIKEKMDLDIQVSKLKLLKANHLSQRYALEDRMFKHYPQQIRFTEERIGGYEKDIALYKRHRISAISAPDEGSADDAKFAGMTIKGARYAEKAEAGTAILEACKQMTLPEPQEIGSYMGFPMLVSFDGFSKQYQVTLRGALSHPVTLGTDIYGNIARINNALAEIPKKLEYCQEQLKTLRQQVETAKEQIEIPFEKEQELQTKSARLAELNILLNMDKRENEVLDDEPDEEPVFQEKKVVVGYER
ncbi:N-6 DNA methylase [Dehalobacter restrictus]|uniref:Helicase n=2 Tax=Dehalobacter restrictus TaxID=55583 RepID=A0A857DGB6_9FIRM|nr:MULTISPECIES: N-6 DNA methylase [Dehalobacter]AHF09017.1 helicase [Dehalobacter restrictus DSM 9455]MCG1024981.1 DEAD/DEAH box helicase family protein [Dehalobacter sp.]QGZ99541.1 helicase [Dehalobacter restrictus]